METFYFTFMIKQYALKDYYVEVEAYDEHHARQVMAEHFGDQWGFCYTEKPLEENASKGCLIKITAIR